MHVNCGWSAHSIQIPSKQATFHTTIQRINQCPTMNTVPLGLSIVSQMLPGTCLICSFPETSGKQCGSYRWVKAACQTHLVTHCATQTALTLLRLGLSGRLVRLAACTEHNSYVSPPGTFLETSRKRPGGPGGGTPRDEDGYKRRDGQGSKGAGRLAAGWAHLARSLTAASAVPIPSGLEFESRDGSCSGTVATGRHKPDKSKTGGLCCLPEELCHQLAPPSRPASRGLNSSCSTA